mmetsp:Transcript_18451/g.40769  ORF Transcript_18451/g.40769 Transcript_18451/m.40769 type:complete len:302 (+) Transcript_18451:798-1703(+)
MQEAALFQEMEQVAEATSPDNVIFVMDSHIGQACHSQASAFQEAIGIGEVIVTKLDGHAKGGGALSAVAATQAPISFIGTGEHFDDLEAFDARSFVSRLMGMGDIVGLVNTMKEVVPMEKNKEMMKRLQDGLFTYADFYEQLQQVNKIGSLKQILGMIPGMNAMGPMQEKAGVARLKRFMVIMDSMTDDELNCKKEADLEKQPSRILRLARGAGVHPFAVGELIGEHHRFEKMVRGMGKAGLMGKQGELTNMVRNPNQVMQKIQQCVDPRMLQQLGGAHNMLNVMKEMEQAEKKVGRSGKA